MTISLPYLVAATILVSLNAYALSGGADFGGGVWDLLATGPRAAKQRELVEKAIAPIWEANHVWLVLVIVLLFTAFPPVFARLSTVLHIPLTLLLAGIVMRGSAFVFRAYDLRGDAAHHRWGRVFAIASLISPLLLGVVIGAIASGTIAEPDSRSFVSAYVHSWLSSFSVLVGLLTLVLFAFLAAVYLTVEARDRALQEDFRFRALVTAMIVFVVAGAALVAARAAAPAVGYALTEGPAALVIHAATAAAAITAIAALYARRYRLARAAAAAQVSLILWGWAVSQLPYLVPPDLRVEDSAAPDTTLRLLLVALALGLVVLVPSLRYLYRVFKRELAA